MYKLFTDYTDSMEEKFSWYSHYDGLFIFECFAWNEI